MDKVNRGGRSCELAVGRGVVSPSQSRRIYHRNLLTKTISRKRLSNYGFPLSTLDYGLWTAALFSAVCGLLSAVI